MRTQLAPTGTPHPNTSNERLHHHVSQSPCTDGALGGSRRTRRFLVPVLVLLAAGAVGHAPKAGAFGGLPGLGGGKTVATSIATTAELDLNLMSWDTVSDILFPPAAAGAGTVPFSIEDQVVADERNVYAWMTDWNNNDLYAVRALCVITHEITMADGVGHLFGSAGGTPNLEINQDHLPELAFEGAFPAFDYEAAVGVAFSVKCYKRLTIEEDADGTISADPNDWDFDGRLILSLSGDLDLTLTVEGIEASGRFTATTDAGAVQISDLTNFEIYADDLTLRDDDGVDVLQTVQDALDSAQATVESWVDALNWIPFVHVGYPTVNRIDGQTLQALFEERVHEEINAAEEIPEQLLDTVNDALDHTLTFSSSPSAGGVSVDATLTLEDVQTPTGFDFFIDPALQSIWTLDLEVSATEDACADGLEQGGYDTDIDWNYMRDFDRDLNAVIPYGLIDLAIYKYGKMGHLCQDIPAQTPSPGVTVSGTIVPDGPIGIAPGAYANLFGMSRDALEITIPMAATMTGTMNVGSTTAPFSGAATATLHLFIVLDVDCDNGLFLSVKDAYIDDFDGTVTVGTAPLSYTMAAPNLTGTVNAQLESLYSDSFIAYPETQLVWEGCVATTSTVLRTRKIPCELCEISLGQAMTDVSVLGLYPSVESFSYGSETLTMGIDLKTGDQCEETSSSSGSPDEDCFETEIKWAGGVEDFTAFPIVDEAQIAKQIAELRELFDPSQWQEQIDAWFDQAVVGPFYPTDWYGAYSAILATAEMGMNVAQLQSIFATEATAQQAAIAGGMYSDVGPTAVTEAFPGALAIAEQGAFGLFNTFTSQNPQFD